MNVYSQGREEVKRGHHELGVGEISPKLDKRVQKHKIKNVKSNYPFPDHLTKVQNGGS